MARSMRAALRRVEAIIDAIVTVGVKPSVETVAACVRVSWAELDAMSAAAFVLLIITVA